MCSPLQLALFFESFRQHHTLRSVHGENLNDPLDSLGGFGQVPFLCRDHTETQVPTVIRPGRSRWRGGTLFVTTCLGARDGRNKDGYTHAYIHRSTDGGRTWDHTRIGPEGFPSKADARCSRNVVELPDGTLLLGVGATGALLHGVGRGKVRQNNYLWTSRDGGKTWQQGKQVTIGNYRDLPFDR